MPTKIKIAIDPGVLDFISQEQLNKLEKVYTDLIEKLEPYAPGEEWKFAIKDNINKGEKRLNIVIRNQNLGIINRIYNLDNQVLKHNYFQLEKDLQGKGIANHVMQSSIDLADVFPVKKISLDANLDVGGYAWIRKGYVPVNMKELISELKNDPPKELIQKLKSLDGDEVGFRKFALSPEFRKYKKHFLHTFYLVNADINDPVFREAVIKGADAGYELLNGVERKFVPPQTSNEKIFDKYVRHQIYRIRYAGGLRNRASEILEASEQDLHYIIHEFAEGLEGSQLVSKESQKLLAEMDKALAATRGDAWEEVANATINELKQLAVDEAVAGAAIIEGAVPVALGMKIPSVAHLEAIALTTPFEGKILSDWLETTKNVDIDRISKTAKIGIVQGQTPTQIARSVLGTKSLGRKDGIARKAFRDLEALYLTVTNGIQNQAKTALYNENSDIIKEEYFVATLDSRTTLICASNDGKTFKLNEGPQPPLHFRCRSLRIPYLNINNLGNRGFDSSTEKRLVKDYAKAHNLGNITSRNALPRGHKTKFDTFARTRKRAMVGQVPAQVNFNQWFKRQSKEFQDEYLGAAKAELYRKNNLSLDTFLGNDGQILTLEELRQKGLSLK